VPLSQQQPLIAGVDEVGRGCLAGPVYAAAVILGEAQICGLRDSKQLSASKRERLCEQIQARSKAWAVGIADVEEIDRLNILQASLLAMRRAVLALTSVPDMALVDGNQRPVLECPSQTIINGDATEPAIMAASIVAKVVRDRELLRLDGLFPGYGLAKHKGYGTPQHLLALRHLGASAVHRMSFAPCRSLGLARETQP